MTDRELLDQFVEECNDSVFESLVQRHGGMVFGVCRRILGNHHDAEEAFQATFLVLAQKAGTLSQRESLANWLFGVARRTALKVKTMRAKRHAREKQVESIPDVELAKPDHWPEIVELLDAGLSRLPEKYRVAVVLCDLEGKSHREAGQELGCPEATVSSRLMRARAILAKWFHRQGVALSVGSVAVLLSQQSTSASLPAALVASTAKAASLAALGQTMGASVIAPQVVAIAKGVSKSMFLATFKNAAVALSLIISIGLGAAGLTQWLQAADQPDNDKQAQPTSQLPKPLELLAKYEETLVPYKRMKGIWTSNVFELTPGEEPRLMDDVEECALLRDADRARLLIKTTGGNRTTPRLWEELLHKGQYWVCASNDNDVVMGKRNVSEEDIAERLGVTKTAPAYGVIDGKSIPGFLRKSKLSVQSETLDGNECLALSGVRDDRNVTIWLDPSLNYMARRVLFNKRSSPEDLTIRTLQFDVKQFENQARHTVVAEATFTLTVGPQPIFRPMNVAKIVNGKRVFENPQIPATDENGKIAMEPAKSWRWELRTAACDLDPHFDDAEFRLSLPIKEGTSISMSDAPTMHYEWRDGSPRPGGWRKNLRLYRNRQETAAAERFASSVRDARLCHLHVLVAAMGDDTDPMRETLGKLLDFEESRDSLHYLPLVLDWSELQSESPFFAQHNLHAPQAGEILLAAFDGEGRQLGTLLLAGSDTSSDGRRGIDFLKQHAPAARESRKLLAGAQKKARGTGRRVWIVDGGSRCGPCFRLARWFEDQHALLDQDYVIVKLNDGLDDNVEEVLQKFKRPADAGVPWFAITNADGIPLATSIGPNGNIGFPTEEVDKQHLSQMLQQTAQKLTNADRDRLIKSLGE